LTIRTSLNGSWEIMLNDPRTSIESRLRKYLSPFLSNPQQQLPTELQEIHTIYEIMFIESIVGDGGNDDGDGNLDDYILQVGSVIPSIITGIADTIRSSSLSNVPNIMITSSIIIRCYTSHPLGDRWSGIEKNLRETLDPLISAGGGEPMGRIEWRIDPHCHGDPFIVPNSC
jgi:hypothetical protein